MVKATFDFSHYVASDATNPQKPLFRIEIANHLTSGGWQPDNPAGSYERVEYHPDAAYKDWDDIGAWHIIPGSGSKSTITLLNGWDDGGQPNDLAPGPGYTFNGLNKFYFSASAFPSRGDFYSGPYHDLRVLPSGWHSSSEEADPRMMSDSQRYIDAVDAWFAKVADSQVSQIDVYGIHDSAAHALKQRAEIKLASPTKAKDLFIEGALTQPTIIGTNFDDEIRGLVEDRNTFIASAGADKIIGGAEVDIFDFSKTGALTLSQTLIGGGDNDILKLPGAASDYTYAYSFFDPTSHAPMPLWENTTTTISRASTAAGQPQLTLTTKTIEKAEFEKPIENQVHLYHDNKMQEMLVMTRQIYDWGQKSLLTEKPVLASYPGGRADFANLGLQWGSYDAVPTILQRGWHPVAGIEIGLMPTDADQGDLHNHPKTLHYSFVNGFYAAYNTADIYKSNGDVPEANALVLSGVVNGERTVAVVFRGTDQVADFKDYHALSNHYQKYVPLVAALKDYIADPKNGIQQVLVSGDSLGGAMAQYFMQEFPNDPRVRGYTEGSPGTDATILNSTEFNKNLVNIVHTDDLVGNADEISHKFGVPTLAGILGVVYSDAFADAQQKVRLGSVIRINSEDADSYFYGAGVSAEHYPFSYHGSIERLGVLAAERPLTAEKAGPFSDSPVAQALRSGEPYGGASVQIAPGSSADDLIHSERDDNYVLGGAGSDTIDIAHKHLAAGAQRIIDGGKGFDTLVLREVQHESVNWILQSDGGYRLSTSSGYHEPYEIRIADVYRVEKLVFANDLVDGQPYTVSLATGLSKPQRASFDGDRHSDVLFSEQGAAYAAHYQWQMNDRAIKAQSAVDLYDSSFSLQVIGDYDGDGKSDVVFQNPTTGGVWVWLLDGVTVKSQGAVDVADPSYHLLGSADFNGDGRDDLLFRNGAGFVYQWHMNGIGNTPLPVGPLDPSWHVQGAGDFDGDGNADILLRNIGGDANTNGAFFLWKMDGNAITSQGGIERPPTDWKTLGLGDFDGDGKTDFAVRNVSATGDNGAVWLYLMDGTTIKAQGAAGIADAAAWHVQQIGDFNGDGKDDILFRNDAGYFYSWDMNGTTIASEGLAGTEAGNWADPSLKVVTQHWDLA